MQAEPRRLLFPPDRRQHDAETGVARLIIGGLLTLGVLMVGGNLLLIAAGKQAIDYGQLIGLIVGALAGMTMPVGPRQRAGATVNTGSAENVTFEAPQTETEKA